MASIITTLKNKLVEANARIYSSDALPYSDEEAISALTRYVLLAWMKRIAHLGCPVSTLRMCANHLPSLADQNSTLVARVRLGGYSHHFAFTKATFLL